MSDAFFIPQFIPQTYADRVQRGAVLYPLTGIPKSDKDITDATFQVLRRWRSFLTLMAGYGWSPRQDATLSSDDMQYARNCRPSFIHCRPQTMLCRLDYICPFCYARWVRRVWEMVDLVFPNPRSLEPPPLQISIDEPEDSHRQSRVIELPAEDTLLPGEFPYWLIERWHETNWPYLPSEEYREAAELQRLRRSVKEVADDAPRTRRTYSKDDFRKKLQSMQQRVASDTDKFQEYLELILREMISRRQRMQKELSPLGMFSHITIEPYPLCWHVKQRQLLVVPAGYDLAGRLDNTRGSLRVHQRPTRPELFKAVTRSCLYPSRMLSRDPVLLALLLRARKRYRLTATSGLFRNRQTINEIHRRREL